MRTELKFHDNFQSEIQLKNIENKIGNKDFTIRTDDPEVMGGDEEYPTPWGVFLTALTACQGMNIHEYCTRNGLKPDGITVSLDIHYAEVKPGEKPREVSRFDIQISVPADFPSSHIEGMKQAARDCKIVKHILDYKPEFHYTVVEQ